MLFSLLFIGRIKDLTMYIRLLFYTCRTLREGLLEDIERQFPKIIAEYKALRPPAEKQEEGNHGEEDAGMAARI
jgi:hypothetical protein